MSRSALPSYRDKKLEELEEEILVLEIENHKLQQKVKHDNFARYKLQKIQKLAKTGTWELNHLTYKLVISNELSQLLCENSMDLSDVSWHDFLDMMIVVDNRDIKKELFENVVKSGKSLDFEHLLIRPDGEVIYVRHSCKTFYNTIGQPLITIGLIHDSTIEHNQSLELKKRSMTDELTRLFNRRYMNNIIKEQHDIFLRHNTTSSYIMLDIDRFKKINDLFGHQVGDEVLQRIAKCIKEGIRSIDYAGRWGGEEFLIICPNTSLEKASLLTEKLRKGLMELKTSTESIVTASFGVGEIFEGEGTNALLKRVDEALYQAKANGRNTLVKSYPS